MRVPRLASNLRERATRLSRLLRLLGHALRQGCVMPEWPLITLPRKSSSSQRSNDGIKSLTGIVWFELYLQATLSAIQEYAWLGHGCFVDSNRNTLFLCEGTDSANTVAGQPFGVGWTHHLCRLAVECISQLFHADFTIRRDDDTDRLAIDLSHMGF